jgi:tetratricopeptide (TPR) repeat protein
MKTQLAIAQKFLLLSAGVAVAFAGGKALSQTPNPQVEVRNLMQAGRLPEAGKEIAHQLQRPDPEPGMQLLQCVVQAQQNQTDKAIACLSALVKQRPEMLEAYNNLGVLHASQGQHEEAKRWFTLGMQRQPTLWTLHQNLQSLQADLSRKAYARALQNELPLKDAPPKLALLASTSLSNTPIAVGNKAPEAPAAGKAPLLAQAPASAAAQLSAQPTAQPTATGLATATSAPPTATPTAPAAKSETAKAQPPARSALAQADASPTASTSAGAAPRDLSAEKTGKASALDDANRQQLQDAVQAWAKAWSDQNMPAYLASYTPDYTPSKSTTRAEWKAERTARIVGRQFVRVKVGNVSFEKKDAKVITRFNQVYESDNIQSTHRKRLEWVQVKGRWKIARETVIGN